MRNSPNDKKLSAVWLSAALLSGVGGAAFGGIEYEAVYRAKPNGSGPRQLLPSHVAEGRGVLALGDLHVYWLGGSFEGGIGEFPYLRRAGLDGQNPEDVLAIVFIGDITIDTGGQKIYFTLRSDCVPCGEIRRSDLDGSNHEILFDAASPTSIAFDPANGVVCWADLEFETIEHVIVCGTLGADGKETILLTKADGMAIDSTGQKIYWTGEGSVRRANLDGSNVETLVTGLDTPLGVALDLPGNRMFWADEATGRIQSAELDGSNVQDVVTGLTAPTDLGFLDQPGEADDRIYWLSVPPAGGVPATAAWGRLLLIGGLLTGMAMFLLRRS